MSRFDGFHSSYDSWQDLYAQILCDLLVPEGFQVFANKTYDPRSNQLRDTTREEMRPVSLRLERVRREAGAHQAVSMQPRQLRVVFIERQKQALDARLPDGLDMLQDYNLSIFSNQVLEVDDFNRFASYAQDYANCRSIANIQNDLGLLAVAPRITDEVRRLLKPIELMPGFLECSLAQAPRWRILLTRDVIDIRENLLWRLLSFDPPKVREALRLYQVRSSGAESLLEAVRSRMIAERLLEGPRNSGPFEANQPFL